MEETPLAEPACGRGVRFARLRGHRHPAPEARGVRFGRGFCWASGLHTGPFFGGSANRASGCAADVRLMFAAGRDP